MQRFCLAAALLGLSIGTQASGIVPGRNAAVSDSPLDRAGDITCSHQRLLAHARVVAEELHRLDGRNRQVRLGARSANGLHLTWDQTLKPEEFRVHKNEVRGGSVTGVAWGTAAVLQAYPGEVSAADRPDYAYRGVMVDVARKWHSIDTLKQAVNLCRFYRVRYLQLHLTDDQAFTFRSRTFPELAAYNQHGGRSYFRRELEELVDYADERGVTIVPEIDVPGHSAVLVKARPDLFKISGTQPYEHHATINFADDKAVAAIKTIIGEICEVFQSSPFIHIGGDEADYRLAHQNPAFQKAFAELGLSGESQHELYRRFLIQMNDAVKGHGKQMIVWEGFGRERETKFPIPKDVLVMEFESAYYLPLDLLDDGYDVVNAAWSPLYAVNRHRWPARKIFEWNPLRFGRHGTTWPAITWFDAQPTNHIVGAQYCAWEQPEFRMMESLIDSVPAMAERVWGSTSDWASYESRAEAAKRRFCELYQPVQINAENLNVPGQDDFAGLAFFDKTTLTFKSLRPGFIRYTTDESPVTGHSPLAPAELVLDKTTVVRAALFSAKGARIGGETGLTFYKDLRPVDNLARAKPVSSSGGTEGPQSPELAVDGKFDLGSSWWAKPAPQWIQVDLEKPTDVGAIAVYPYWDGSRFYQYIVEGSLDGKNWTMLMDRTTNTLPASSSGDRQEIAAKVRYVRVTMLRNSANEGVHLVELVVEKPSGRLAP